MFQILELTKNDIVAFKVSDKVHKTDYDVLNPLLKKTEKEHTSIKLFIEIGDIKGISAQALLKDVVTYFKHVKHVEKVAVVGQNKMDRSWAKMADPFIRADIKYFPLEEKDLAMDWIQR
jgi:hypothetical protein